MSDSDSERHPLDRLAEDFVSRRRRGETPSVSEYVKRYPDQAEDIRDLFPALALIEQVRPESADGGSRSSRTPVEPLPEQLGDFRILREIGRGGMGIVYEAEQESLGRRVALKVLPEEASRNPRYLQRFEREAQAAARLHHTNIVPVFGVGQHEGRHFFVMQYIPGCGLDEVLRDLCILRDLSAGDLQTQGISTQS
ncbi:MAG: protein kinase, partial [Planctomycetaceae bacterium]|nr:protein kinase [Planctomycetaceae bacterium]